MIVKIQRAVFPRKSYVLLIYNKSKSMFLQTTDVPVKLKKMMGNDDKKFFHARLKGTQLVIDNVAKWQDW